MGTNERTALAAALLGLGILALLWNARQALRGSTLMAPWAWACLSIGMAAGSEVAAGLAAANARWIVPLRFVAAMSTFCPLMAVLGAKRPQDRAWQFIVLALWLVLCLPAAEWWLFDSGAAAEIHPVRSWFLLALAGVAALNYLPTRFRIASLFYSAAQIVLLWAYLPFGGGSFPGAAGSLLGLALAAIACVAARRARPAPAANSLDRAWLDFRDRFGVLWALRAAEQINASGRLVGWPLQLGWNGFSPRGEDSRDGPAPLPGDVEPAVALALRNILRRFVSDVWLSSAFRRKSAAKARKERKVGKRASWVLTIDAGSSDFS